MDDAAGGAGEGDRVQAAELLLMRRQVWPVVFSMTLISSNASQHSWTWPRCGLRGSRRRAAVPSWISGLASHEVYEIVDTFTWSKLGAFVLSVFLVVYLLWTKRLFGLCGGHAAFKAERDNIWLLKAEREMISLLEVERALAAR